MVDLDCSVCLRFHHGAMVFDLDPLQGSRNFEDFQVMEFCLEGAAFDKKRSGNIDKLSPEVLELKLLRQIPLGQETAPHPYIYVNIAYIYIDMYTWYTYMNVDVHGIIICSRVLYHIAQRMLQSMFGTTFICGPKFHQLGRSGKVLLGWSCGPRGKMFERWGDSL